MGGSTKSFEWHGTVRRVSSVDGYSVSKKVLLEIYKWNNNYEK